MKITTTNSVNTMNPILQKELQEIGSYMYLTATNYRKILLCLIGRLKEKYPNDSVEIEKEFRMMCKKTGFDLFAEIRISPEEIAEYVENNVPPIEE